MGVDVVLSLLTVEESEEMNLQDEERVSRQNGVVFLSFPIVDRDAPALDSTTTCLLEQVDRDLTNGKNVLVHCRQGVGRSGLIAAALLVVKGLSPNAAIQRISQARHVPVPETKQQRNWIDSFAANLSPTSQARAN
jgi:protein-tyrosine phosphatase